MDSILKMKYGVGALLYSPALNDKTADKVINQEFGNRYSLAFCLEDTIGDSAVEAAEKQLEYSFKKIFNAAHNLDIKLPMIFVRVRAAEQMMRVFKMTEKYPGILTGFIMPKYTVLNCEKYNAELIRINEISRNRIYMMPIIESGDIADLKKRYDILYGIKNAVDSVQDYLLGIRVGGNDFSNIFAVRRHCDETIYDIMPVSQLLCDILTVFSKDYVVSGPVWEFFSGSDDAWKTGLEKELKLDKLNGFVGKTVIHPNQIPIVNRMLRVPRSDYEDAKRIVSWDNELQVGKSFGGDRMNEIRTNYNWAVKTMLLAEIYGVE